MKKRLITYFFIVCSICLHAGGFASPVKTSRTVIVSKSSYAISPRLFTFKKASLALADCLRQNNNNFVFQHGSIRVLYPVVPYFKAEPNFFLTISDHVPGEAIIEKEVERVLKDHLLHLFPSHYFW
jgi:hypothetical protein